MKTAVFLAALLPSIAVAGNFATCLLDKLPSVQNDVAAQAVFQVCIAKHPGGFAGVTQGSGRGWFSYKSGPDCTMGKAGETRSLRAAGLIGAACRKLYDESAPFDPSTAVPFN